MAEELPEALGRALRKRTAARGVAPPQKKTRRRAPKPDATLLKDLGVRLQTLRRTLYPRLTQQAAADILGVSRYWLGQVETGRADPQYSQLVALATLYRVPLRCLCDPAPPQPQEASHES